MIYPKDRDNQIKSLFFFIRPARDTKLETSNLFVYVYCVVILSQILKKLIPNHKYATFSILLFTKKLLKSFKMLMIVHNSSYFICM